MEIKKLKELIEEIEIKRKIKGFKELEYLTKNKEELGNKIFYFEKTNKFYKIKRTKEREITCKNCAILNYAETSKQGGIKCKNYILKYNKEEYLMYKDCIVDFHFEETNSKEEDCITMTGEYILK